MTTFHNIRLITCFVLLLSFTACTEKNNDDTERSFIVTDDLNNKVEFSSSPQRIISLAPNITEMIYQLELGKNLVGNTKYCYYPEEAKEVNKVGDLLTFNYEKIIELNPDIVFITVEGNQKTAYERLINLGYKVFVSNPRDFSGIKKTFLDLGKIFQKSKLASDRVSKWDSTYSLIKDDAQKLVPRSVMILVELNPIMIAGRNTFINSYITTCNMNNFAEDVSLNYPVFSREAVIDRDPDIIVYPSSGEEDIATLTETYPEWAKLSAIENGNVFFVDRDLYFRPGPRFIDAMKDFYSRLLEVN